MADSTTNGNDNNNNKKKKNDFKPPETIDGPASRSPAIQGGSSIGSGNVTTNHKRSHSADLSQAFHRQQQMMMQQHTAGVAATGGGGTIGSITTHGSFPYANPYGGGGAVPPPPPPPHGYYYAYGAPPPPEAAYSPYGPAPDAYTQVEGQQQQQQQQQQRQHPAHPSRARSWSGDAAMFDRQQQQQQQMQWIAAMQQQQQQQQQPPPPPANYSVPLYTGGVVGGTTNAVAQPSTPRSTRHQRSLSSSSAGGGGGGTGGSGTNAPFSPRSEFIKLTGGNPNHNSPAASPLARYNNHNNNFTARNVYSPRMQVPMTSASTSSLPPPQAYETMYDTFGSNTSSAAAAGGGAIGNTMISSPYLSPDKKAYGSTGGGSNGRTSPFATPDKIAYGSGNLANSSIGSARGGEAVYLAQRARAIAAGGAGGNSSGPSSSRKRHMRQQSVQLFMQEVKGVEQSPACRDVFFLLFFVFHLFGMVLLSNMYSYEAIQHSDEVQEGTGFTVNYDNLLVIAGFSGAFAMVVSTALLSLMSYLARNFVQVALIVAIALSFVWGTLGIGLSPKNLVPVTGIVALALSVAYAIVVWDRLPFSTANLRTALMAMRTFPGTIVMTLVSQVMGLGWSIYYAVICCGVYDAIQDGRIAVPHRYQVLIYVLMAISYYWTIQVFLNAVQVATAAVVGQWWYHPDGAQTVQKSSFKTIFYSMGSICFGSLFVGPVKVIRQFSVFFRPSSDEASLLLFHGCLHCIQTCITDCVEGLVQRFNPWGFAYVGLYGYAFPEAASLATELFAKRGWTTIVSDDLVSNVLLMTSVVVGGVTGCFSFLLSGIEELHVTSLDTPGIVSFFVGLVIGLVLTSILFGAINGSVNAVIILFATSPVDFERNHQSLSHEMRSAWREVWPGAVDDVDVRLALAGAGGNGSNHSAVFVGSPMLGHMSSGVVPPPMSMVPDYAHLSERTRLMNDR